MPLEKELKKLQEKIGEEYAQMAVVEGFPFDIIAKYSGQVARIAYSDSLVGLELKENYRALFDDFIKLLPETLWTSPKHEDVSESDFHCSISLGKVINMVDMSVRFDDSSGVSYYNSLTNAIRIASPSYGLFYKSREQKKCKLAAQYMNEIITAVKPILSAEQVHLDLITGMGEFVVYKDGMVFVKRTPYCKIDFESDLKNADYRAFEKELAAVLAYN